MAPGKVYIGAMNLRGRRAPKPHDDVISVNVTSCQSKSHPHRLDFSPMTPIDGGYKGFWNFESYWQSGKVIEGVDRETQLRWWKRIEEPKRRYPGSKGKKVLYAQWDDGEKMDYITSRKKVYVPEYNRLTRKKPSIDELRRLLEEGKDIIIYDLDGPREDGEPVTLEVTKSMLREKIKDPRYPFGHGYVVAALIAGIKYKKYVKLDD